MSGLTVLLNNRGSISGVNITGDWTTWSGGPGDFWVWGDLGGGQVDLHAALDESAPVIVCGTTIRETSDTSAAVVKFNFNHGTRIRAVVTLTTGTSSGIFAKVNE